MLRIGVSSCFFYPDINRLVFGHKTLCYLERDMARYLAREDVIPILIPDLETPALESLLKDIDGLVLQGGSDIAPGTYGEDPILEGKWPGDPYRDEYELKLIDFAISKGLPILGICRGFQLLNVYFGGTLYQDLNTQYPDTITHRSAEIYDQLYHDLSIEDGSLLSKLHKDDPNPKVNSVHHQGIDKLGTGLKIMASCPEDGIIEAFIHKNHPDGRIMGVQWHPEFFHNFKQGKLIDANPVYDHFLSLCRK